MSPGPDRSYRSASTHWPYIQHALAKSLYRGLPSRSPVTITFVSSSHTKTLNASYHSGLGVLSFFLCVQFLFQWLSNTCSVSTSWLHTWQILSSLIRKYDSDSQTSVWVTSTPEPVKTGFWAPHPVSDSPGLRGRCVPRTWISNKSPVRPGRLLTPPRSACPAPQQHWRPPERVNSPDSQAHSRLWIRIYILTCNRWVTWSHVAVWETLIQLHKEKLYRGLPADLLISQLCTLRASLSQFPYG